jgi:hypothetical protein
MTAEFNVWLLLVGLIVGGGLTWLVIGELRRSEGDVGRSERELEAGWIAEQLAGTDRSVSEDQAEAVLGLHQRYLATSLPPAPFVDADAPADAAADDDVPPASETSSAGPTAPQPGDVAAPMGEPVVSPPRRRQRGHRPTS